MEPHTGNTSTNAVGETMWRQGRSMAYSAAGLWAPANQDGRDRLTDRWLRPHAAHADATKAQRPL